LRAAGSQPATWLGEEVRENWKAAAGLGEKAAADSHGRRAAARTRAGRVPARLRRWLRCRLRSAHWVDDRRGGALRLVAVLALQPTRAEVCGCGRDKIEPFSFARCFQA